jgi:hypothetical protein
MSLVRFSFVWYEVWPLGTRVSFLPLMYYTPLSRNMFRIAHMATPAPTGYNSTVQYSGKKPLH